MRRNTNGRQIQRLEESLNLQTLTPRALAKSMTDLETLRARVVELEYQLANQQAGALTPQKLKLPPLTDTEHSSVGLNVIGAKSTCKLKTVSSDSMASYSGRIATAPAETLRDLRAVESGAGKGNKIMIKAELSSKLSGFKSNSAAITSNHDIYLIQADVSADENSGGNNSSAHDVEINITIEQEGKKAATFAKFQRNRLDQILKRLSLVFAMPEDELFLLKNLVNAEVGNVIEALLDIESEQSVAKIRDKLTIFLKHGPLSKLDSIIRPPLFCYQSVSCIPYPLFKIAQNLEHLRGAPILSPGFSSSKKTDVIVLVSSGAYNPIHMLHIRAFSVARQYVESNFKFPVVGAFFSPSHDTYVRGKNRRNTREMITKRHRLALLETAVASSSWIEVDKWEITRRRVLDYLSTLTHVREMCDLHFPQYRFHVIYVCGCNTVVTLSHSALRDEGFKCIAVCRPAQTDMVMKQLGKSVAKATTIVEDTGVLPCELERTTSFRVRQTFMDGGANINKIAVMVGEPVFRYLVRHEIGDKIAGKISWTKEDKQWRQQDLTYVEYSKG